MPLFRRYIGIDYSGASSPTKPVRGLKVFCAEEEQKPEPQFSTHPQTPNWDRDRLASWLLERITDEVPCIVGIDHAFSYTREAMDELACNSWDEFLDWFDECWATRQAKVSVCIPPNLRFLIRNRGKLRLTDKWTTTAMSLFDGWEANGSNVFYSTHAGIPWLRWLRQELRATGKEVHFWPFDGYDVPSGKSVVAEVYPRIFARRYQTDLEGDARDAFLVCRWLQDRDLSDRLEPYFNPPLTEEEVRRAQLEGWILGVA